jgi:hypothetical protein
MKPKYHSLNGLRDAASFRNVLVEEAGYKFENVKLISDALQGPINHFIILQHLRKMIITSKSGDELTFFFSGHGGFDGSVPKLLCGLLNNGKRRYNTSTYSQTYSG